MKAYIVQTGQILEPFGDAARDSLVLNRSVAEHQREAIEALGGRLVAAGGSDAIRDEQEHLIVDDALMLTPELLAEFVSRSRALAVSTICALKIGLTTQRTVVTTQCVDVQDGYVSYPLRYVPAGGANDIPRPIVIEPDRMWRTLPLPRHMFGDEEYRFPVTERFIVRIDHWTNLMMANLLSLSALGARLRYGSKMRLLALALKARSANPWQILRKANRIGRDCDIHPTAYVEGCTIGDGVTIGAGSIVRTSIIGDRTFIGNGAIVELGAIGEHCNIMNGCIVQGSVLLSGTFTNARLVSACVLGRDTFLGDGVTLSDFRLDGQCVLVLADGAKVSTENGVIGSCLGHGAYLGAGCVVAPGRMVPNGWHLTPEPSRVLASLRNAGNIPGHRLVMAKT